jgi:YYY domain-containing protein
VKRTDLLLLLLLTPVPAALWLLGDSAGLFFVWWIALTVPGWLLWPLTARLMPDGDQGYLTAKALGLAGPTFLLWTLSYLHLLPFSRVTIIAVLLLCGTLAWTVGRGYRFIGNPLRQKGLLLRIVSGECLFAFALLFWTYARGLKPDLDSLEKFMNIGFMNSLWRAEYLPALDMWFAGGTINYYYFGQYVYTWLAKLTNIRPEIAYNLGMATTFALTVILSYTIGSRLIGIFRRHEPGHAPAWSTAGGLLAAVLVSVFGNGHAFFFSDNGPGRRLLEWVAARGWINGDAGQAFWFADSTRFIGYNPETADKTIHEFPYYSFLVADLHAHLINLAFVLLLVILLLVLFERPGLARQAADCRATQQRLAERDDRQWHAGELRAALRRLKQTAGDGVLGLCGLLLAIFMMGNYWDFAIYFVVAAITLFLVNLRGYGRLPQRSALAIFAVQAVLLLIPFLKVGHPVAALLVYAIVLLINHYLTVISGDPLTLTGAQISWLFLIAHTLTLPFGLAFEPIAKSVALAVNHTPLWQLLILWGPHVLAGLLLTAALLWLARRSRLRVFPPPPEQADQLSQTRLQRLAKQANPADLIALALLIWGIGLILLPEVVYVVDIYSGDYKRANTMFKFTYQAYVLLSLVWAYGIARLAACRRSIPAQLIAALLSLLLIVPGWYPVVATRQWLGEYRSDRPPSLYEFRRDRFLGLDGLVQYAGKDSALIPGSAPGELAADVAAIRWFNEQVTGQPVILESFGESYTDYCRISAFTGLPTVMGWETHEWLWRTSKSTANAYGLVVRPRQEDVSTLYTTTDQTIRQALLRQYRVAYIVIGAIERTRFAGDEQTGRLQEDLLLQLGTVVFTAGDLVIIQVD